MVALKTERRVFLWKLTPKPVPIEAGKPVTMAEVVDLLKEEFEGKRARAFLSSDGRFLDDGDPDADPKHQIYIAAINDTNPDTLTLLFNRGDPNAVSPAFIDYDTSDVRIEHPKAKESPGWSAHLVLSLKSKAGTHKACFEQMPKVSASLVMAMIDRILTTASAKKKDYKFIHVIGKGKKQKKEDRVYRPYLSLKRVPSERLEDDLREGYLSSITLTRMKSHYQGPGAARMITRQEERVKITTRKIDDDTVVKDFISGVTAHGRDEGFENVTFRLEGLPGGQTKEATLSLDEEYEAMDALYVRARRLNEFSSVLEGCYKSVCSQIESAMLKVLSDQAAWREV